MSNDIQTRTTTQARGRLATDPAHQAFMLLRTVFTVAPILFGLDKFFNVLVDWPIYLAPWVDNIVPGTAQQAMYAVGVIEIVAGILVAITPRWGASCGRTVAGGHHCQSIDPWQLLRHRPARLRAISRGAGSVPPRGLATSVVLTLAVWQRARSLSPAVRGIGRWRDAGCVKRGRSG